MRNKYRWGSKLIISLFSLVCVVGGTFACHNLINQDLSAAAPDYTEDIKVKKLNYGSNGGSACFYVTSEAGDVYERCAYGNIDNVYFEKIRIKKEDGVTLEKIKDITTGTGTNRNNSPTATVVLTDEGRLYFKGNANTYGVFGDGTYENSTDYKFVDPNVPGTIKRVDMGIENTYLLMENGDVYASGHAIRGALGNGTAEGPTAFPEQDSRYSNIFAKVNISNVREIYTRNYTVYAVDNEGYLWGWGSLVFTGSSYQQINSPERIKNADGTLFDVKVSKMADCYLGGDEAGYAFWGEDNKLYYAYSKAEGLGILGPRNYGGPKESTFTFPGFNPQTPMVISIAHIHTVIGGVLYNWSSGQYIGPSNQSAIFKPFEYYDSVGQKVVDASTPVLQGGSSMYNGYVLRADGKMFIEGFPAQFRTEISITGKKADNSEYKSKDKYKDTISLWFNRGGGHNEVMQYQEADMPSGSYGTAIDVSSDENINIPVLEGDRIYKKYKASYKGVTGLDSEEFIVDIYKHSIDVNSVSITNGETQPRGFKLTWDKTNGLEGNEVSATLQKSNGAALPIVHGYEVQEIGMYNLILTDKYGNMKSFAFEIANVPPIKAVTFTPANNPLKYNSDATNTNGKLGKVVLEYNEGDVSSGLKTLELSNTDTTSPQLFTIEKNNETEEFYIKARSDIPADSYTVTLNGSNKNNTEFRNKNITINVVKADSPMTWDTTTNDAIANGKHFNDDVTIGTVDKPAELGAVTYSLVDAATGDSVDSTTGVLTIAPVTGDATSKIVKIKATTAESTNYNEKTLTDSITYSKQSLKLKTVIVEGGVNKDTYNLELGSQLPSFNIKNTEALPTGVTLNSLTPDSYKVYDSLGAEVTNITTAGTYEVKPVYNNTNTVLDNYKVDWTYATITAAQVTINESNASDYYTLTLEGETTPYTLGTWSNKNIIITPKHATYKNMKIGTGTFKTDPQTYSAQGDKNVTLTFKTASNIEATTTVNIKLDTVKPTMSNITFSDASTSIIENLIRAFSFDSSASKPQTATFSGTDTNGSGISTYHYVVTEINNDGTHLRDYDEGEASTVDLGINKMYKVVVYAIDNAGNHSADTTRTIQISDVAPKITIKAYLSGTQTPYNSGEWTSKGIDVNLSSDVNISQYAMSTDAATYTNITSPYIIPNDTNLDGVTYTFKGISDTGVEGTKDIIVKIDTTVPTFDMKAVTSDGNDYDGTNTEYDVIINLSQKVTEANISGVTYYYCDNFATANTNPAALNATGWTKITGKQQIFKDDTKTTYYFKAVSGAGVASTTAKTQKIDITNILDNPAGLKFKTPGNEEVTYGESIPLTIMLDDREVPADEITITPNGGTRCLEYDDTTKTVKAISGTCPTTTNGSMEISAEVGIYREPLKKTITAKKADLTLQTQFMVNSIASNKANILKDGTVPTLSVDYAPGSSLITDDATLVTSASALGNFTPEYFTSADVLIDNFDTTTIGSYKVKNNLTLTSVNAIIDFGLKYAVTTLPGILEIGDNAFADSELYTIDATSGSLSESGWYTNKVTITPVHTDFTKMGIGNETPSAGAQTYPSGDVIDVNGSVGLKFEDASGNRVTKSPTIKIDSRVPEVNDVSAMSNGTIYSGIETNNDVTISLSQPNNNISGVTYYYCTSQSTSDTDPTEANGWTKLTGNTKKFDKTENTTYYFKAVSGAGLMSTTPKSQKIHILKRDPNPVGMDWTAGLKDDLAYGDVVPLTIENTNGEEITYTSSGGGGCLSLDTTAGTLTATSGVCATDMTVTATVGNYATPLNKTFTTHKVDLELQTVLLDAKNKPQKRIDIFKGETAPNMKVELSKGALVSDEQNLKINDISTYNPSYTLKGGSTSTNIDTNTIGEYTVTSLFDIDTVTVTDFNKKYKITKQNSATLTINDPSFTDAELYTITGGNPINDVWYTAAVTITPIHPEFTKMGIDNETPSAGAQTYPKNGEVNVETTIDLTFANSGGSTFELFGVPIKIDSVKPTFSIVATSNNATYASGSATMYDIDVQYVATNQNISNVTYYYTKDVLSNGNMKPDANWTESGNFTISENGTYYMKAVSGAGLESEAQKFVANIERPNTGKQPTVEVTSNGKSFVADGSTWTANDVTFKLSGNTGGYEVCTSIETDRNIDCADTSTNWTTINNATDSIHQVTQDQEATQYYFRNKIPGFTTVATKAYTVKLDNVLPDTPTITVTEKQNALFSLFANTNNPFHNKAVTVEIETIDAQSGIARILYDVYDKDQKLIKENQSYTDVLTYEDINIQLRAKAIDHAGNVSTETDFVAVCVDSIAPQINGITKDASYYVPYVFISFLDSGSGIDASKTTYTNNEITEELGNNTLFNGKGNVSVNVQDNAGNASTLSFEMMGLPEHSDCSAESMALIDTVKAQYNDLKGHLNETQKKEILDWMSKASNSCSVTDPDHNVTVENPEAKIPENTVLVVDVITKTIEDVKVPLEDDEEIKIAYDVYFKKDETVFKDLEGSEMKVKLPLGAFKGAKGLRLVSVEEDGTTQEIAYETEGDYAVFITGQLKRYAFIAEKSTDPNINVDYDCDGTVDINIDVGGDGIPDINIDTKGDGIADYNVDLDGDKIPDLNIGPIDWNPDKCTKTACGKAYCTSTYYKPYLNIDTDGDKRPDINIDTNKDMEAEINIDTDFDNIPNTDIDSIGDGTADINIDDNGDGEADQNKITLKTWKPELDVETPIKYDTMANLKGDNPTDDPKDNPTDGDDSGSGAGSSTDNKNQNNTVDVTPTVKGNYTSGIGGAMTGQANTLPILFILLIGSTCVLWGVSKRKS